MAALADAEAAAAEARTMPTGLDTWSRPFWWMRLPSEAPVSRVTKPSALMACQPAWPMG
jgi:hypothetical protein